MPLLRRESEIYPDELFALPLETAPWFVVHVLSRREKALARYATQREIPFYLPQIEKTTRRSGRTFRSYLPLFSGYLFLRGGDAARASVVRSHEVAAILDVADQHELQQELAQIRDLQLRGATLTPLVDVAPGDAVRIVDGPFRGYSGIVVSERGSQRLIVSIHLIRKAVAVEFPREMVTPAPRR